MGLYPRRFIQMALVYLMLGVTIGILRSFDIGGNIQGLNFVHLHLNLLGFTVMIISGIGYFVIPRFNGVELYFKSWLAGHFWIANAGLILLVGGYYLKSISVNATGKEIFILGGISSAIGIFMFGINIILTIRDGEKRSKSQALLDEAKALAKIKESIPVEAPALDKSVPQRLSDYQPSAQPLNITESTPVAEIVDHYPAALEILIKEGGLTSLGTPGHIDKVRAIGIPLAMAIKKHGGDLNHVLTLLKESAKSSGTQINKGMIIGEVLESNPQAKEVFKKHFGDGCFSCPGQTSETLEQAAAMHSISVDTLIEDINKASS